MKAIRRTSSSLVGWLADRKVPRPLRRAVYCAYCRLTEASAEEAELALDGYPSLGAFFVRRLKSGARPLDPDEGLLLAPCDGTLQSQGRIERGGLLQAKGREYSLEELLGSAPDAAAFEGAWTATIYLSPRDYHRVHAPLGAHLNAVRWLAGDRRSVAPRVLERVPRVLSTNERAVLRLSTPAREVRLVMVGALNVGRIRVVGVGPGCTPADPLEFQRGAELARFEMGSTVVLVVPGCEPLEGLTPGTKIRLGQALARLR